MAEVSFTRDLESAVEPVVQETGPYRCGRQQRRHPAGQPGVEGDRRRLGRRPGRPARRHVSAYRCRDTAFPCRWLRADREPDVVHRASGFAATPAGELSRRQGRHHRVHKRAPAVGLSSVPASAGRTSSRASDETASRMELVPYSGPLLTGYALHPTISSIHPGGADGRSHRSFSRCTSSDDERVATSTILDQARRIVSTSPLPISSRTKSSRDRPWRPGWWETPLLRAG